MEKRLTTNEALAMVRDELRKGTLVHVLEVPNHREAMGALKNGKKALPANKCFNMNYVVEELPCGSVCCIGGWAAQFAGVRPSRAGDWMDGAIEHEGRGLHRLFYERTDDSITPAQAAQAIDNYLHDGTPHWDAIIGPRLPGVGMRVHCDVTFTGQY